MFSSNFLTEKCVVVNDFFGFIKSVLNELQKLEVISPIDLFWQPYGTAFQYKKTNPGNIFFQFGNLH